MLLSFYPLLLVAYDEIPKTPHGEILYYQGQGKGKGHLFLFDLSTGTSRQVGQSGSRPDHYPNWSPDGKHYVFESYRKGGWHVWIGQIDQLAAKRITQVPAYNTDYYEFDPTFNHNGNEVAYLRDGQLYLKSLITDKEKLLIPTHQDWVFTAPSFSHDGQYIAVTGISNREQVMQVYLINLSSREIKQLTHELARVFAPVWSPVENKLIVHSDKKNGVGLYQVDIISGRLTPVHSQQQLASAQIKPSSFIDPWDNGWGAIEQYRASISPDGDWIVFSSTVDGDRELFVSRVDGSDIRRLTVRQGLDAQPAWRPHVIN